MNTRLSFRVAVDSMWRARNGGRGSWKVTSRYYFELSNQRLSRAVRISHFGTSASATVRHMSEDRFLRMFKPERRRRR